VGVVSAETSSRDARLTVAITAGQCCLIYGGTVGNSWCCQIVNVGCHWQHNSVACKVACKVVAVLPAIPITIANTTSENIVKTVRLDHHVASFWPAGPVYVLRVH
jgi:hypothetical protein